MDSCVKLFLRFILSRAICGCLLFVQQAKQIFVCSWCLHTIFTIPSVKVVHSDPNTPILSALYASHFRHPVCHPMMSKPFHCRRIHSLPLTIKPLQSMAQPTSPQDSSINTAHSSPSYTVHISSSYRYFANIINTANSRFDISSEYRIDQFLPHTYQYTCKRSFSKWKINSLLDTAKASLRWGARTQTLTTQKPLFLYSFLYVVVEDWNDVVILETTSNSVWLLLKVEIHQFNHRQTWIRYTSSLKQLGSR